SFSTAMRGVAVSYENTKGTTRTPYVGSASRASTQAANDSGSLSTWAVMSQGVRVEPYSGMLARNTTDVSSLGWGRATPWISAVSAAMMAAPPEVDTTATPSECGAPALAKNADVSTSLLNSSTTTMPARSNAAWYASRDPAS